MEDLQLDTAQKLIKEARKIAIVPSRMAKTDAYSAGVGLYFMLKEIGKEVSLVYPGQIPEKASHLIDKERVKKDIKERDLIVEIDYSGTDAGAAQYSTKDHKLQVKLGPVSKDFSIGDRIRASLAGFSFDLLIIIGAQNASDLEEDFGNVTDTFNGANVINIDHLEKNSEFGTVNLIDKEAISLSQQILKLAAHWKIIPDDKSAKALLTGMTYRNGNY